MMQHEKLCKICSRAVMMSCHKMSKPKKEVVMMVAAKAQGEKVSTVFTSLQLQWVICNINHVLSHRILCPSITQTAHRIVSAVLIPSLSVACVQVGLVGSTGGNGGVASRSGWTPT